jgi:CRP-like cAMP-binding protein
MAGLHTQIQNHLLASLPVAEFGRIAPHLELVPMPLGESYYESGGELQHVYFPTTAIVSLLQAMKNGAPVEIAGVGNEGMLGISLFMGGNSSHNLAFVRTAGYGYKMKARQLMDEFNRAGSMQRLLLRYTQTLITQSSQTALCNRHHSVAQRLIRWLLLTHDRMPSDELVLTQELAASMIGVCREGVMEAVRKLQEADLIHCCDDRITVLDRTGLKNRACECYSVVKMELDRLLGLDWDWRPMPESVNAWSRANMSIC